MDWQKNRLPIAGLLLLVVGGLAFWAWRSRTGDTVVPETGVRLPDVERDRIASLEISRPGAEETIRLERRGDTWLVTQPLEVPADQSAVSTALDKLDDLVMVGIAASNPSFHERLEVDPEHGVRVVARDESGSTLIDAWIGAYRAGNTMLRLEGEDRVVSVRGSIKFAFNKELRDWRNRSIVEVDADDVREVAWTGPNGTFRFVRPTGEGEDAAPGEWQQGEVSYVEAPEAQPEAPRGRRAPAPPQPQTRTEIAGFQPSKVRSMVGSLARMRAADFAAPDVTPESAGIGPDSPRVTLTVPAQGEGEARTFTVVLGNEVAEDRNDRYAMLEGSPTIYVISRYLGERVSPTAASFTDSAPPSSSAAAPEPEPAPSDEGGGAQLPPEIMEQIRRQLEQQGLGGGAGP